MERYAKRAGKQIRRIKKTTFDLFEAYDWPGNVRELQSVVERADILCEREVDPGRISWFSRRGQETAY